MGAVVVGEVEFVERGTAPPPERVLTASRDTPSIPTLKLRVKDLQSQLVQVLFRGDTPGHVDIGDRVRAEGLLQGGVLRAERIFNETTSSWVTPRGCFVATAATAPDSLEVLRLQRFRDEVLLRWAVGRSAVAAYEKLSPPIALQLASRPVLRFIARWGIVKPASAVVAQVLR